MNEIKIFSPATVSNVACGFDVLGFCFNSVGDDMVVRKTKDKGIKISKIEGYNLPLDTKSNVAGVAALALVEHAKPDCGFEIEIEKKIHPGSGIGSSSASASGVVFAINQLLDNKITVEKQLHYTMIGEYVASGSYHADNVAPALLGGIVLIRGYNPLDYIKLPVP